MEGGRGKGEGGRWKVEGGKWKKNHSGTSEASKELQYRCVRRITESHADFYLIT